jgi:hypothetical protein
VYPEPWVPLLSIKAALAVNTEPNCNKGFSTTFLSVDREFKYKWTTKE